MPKFPEPPPVEALRRVRPETRRLPAGTELWRLYFRDGAHPTRWSDFRAFGPTGSRFDHQLPPPRVQERRILYAAAAGPTCIAEVFQDSKVIDRRARGPWLVCFALARPVELLDLAGAWPTRAGASMAINTGPRSRARRWSQAIYAAYPTVDGVYYASSMDANHPSVALYERAAAAVPERPVLHRALADPHLAVAIGHAALRFGYALV